MKTPQKFLFLSISSGIVSGIVVAVAFTYLTQTREPSFNIIETPGADPASEFKQPVVSNALAKANQQQLQQNHTQLLALERRINELALLKNSDANADAAADDPLAPADDVSPEEARAADLRWWEDTKTEFEQEQIDPEWADSTNQLFMADMSQLAQNSDFTLLHSECRSTRCSAVVEWPSYGEAQLAFTDLLHHSYEANCARHTLLPEPDELDADAPYEVTVIFDCSEWRNQGSIASSFAE